MSVDLLQTYSSCETMSKRNFYWAAAMILFLAVGLRLIGLDKGIWLDEYFSLKKALSQDFLQDLRRHNHPPLYFALLKLWSQISVREEFLRLLSVLFGIATVAVVMAWIKRYSYLGSLLGGMYCATLPVMLRYSQEIRGYSLLLLATALSFFFASRIISDPGRLSGHIGLASSLTLAVATHAVGVMLLPTICIFILMTSSAWKPVFSKRAILTITVPAFVFLFFILLQRTDIDPDDWWMPAVSLPVFLSTTRITLGIDEARWLSEAVSGLLPVSFGGGVVILEAVVVLLGAGLLALGGWKRSMPFLTASVVFWSLMLIYSIFVLPIIRYRTVLPGMIPFIAFLGLQIAGIPGRKARSLAIMGLISLCLVFATQWTVESRSSNWKEMAELLKSTWQPDDVVVVFPQNVEGPFKYYTEVPSQAFLPVRLEDSIEEVERKLGRRIGGLTESGGSYAVLFITRLDRRVKKHPEAHRRLLAYLESKLGKPFLVKRISSLSLSRYELRTGKPSSSD